jgi:hypothetical protein
VPSRDKRLDDEPAADAQVPPDRPEAPNLITLVEDAEQGVIDAEHHIEQQREIEFAEVARPTGHGLGGVGLHEQLKHRRGRIHRVQGYAAGGEREADASGPDAQLQRHARRAEGVEELDRRVNVVPPADGVARHGAVGDDTAAAGHDRPSALTTASTAFRCSWWTTTAERP